MTKRSDTLKCDRCTNVGSVTIQRSKDFDGVHYLCEECNASWLQTEVFKLRRQLTAAQERYESAQRVSDELLAMVKHLRETATHASQDSNLGPST